MTHRFRGFLLLLLALPLFSAQSIDLDTDAFVNVSGLTPVTSKTQSMRIEGHIHGYHKVDYDQVIRSYGLGIVIVANATSLLCTSYADDVNGINDMMFGVFNATSSGTVVTLIDRLVVTNEYQ